MPTLSPFRRERLQARLQSLSPAVRVVGAWHVYWIEPALGVEPDTAVLQRTLQAAANAPARADGAVSRYVAPRLGTISPWASKTTELLRGAGVGVRRVERGTRLDLVGLPDDAQAQAALARALHDPMTQSPLASHDEVAALFVPPARGAATGQIINRGRDDGTLELLFSHPVRRGVYFGAVTLTRFLVLTVPLVATMAAMAAIGRFAFGEAVQWGFLFQSLAVCAALIAAYVGLGLLVSTVVRSQTRAVIAVLVLWALGAALLDFGLIALMLQWRLNPQTVFLLASLNPVQAARMALLAGASAELSILGPVGFYLSTRVGAGGLFTLGLIWPTALGAAAWLFAFRTFRRADLV